MKRSRVRLGVTHRTIPTVAIACPGAGLVGRGYESFAIELAERLQGREDLVAFLLSGGTVSGNWVRRVPAFARFGRPARLAATAFKWPPTLVEQVTFGLASIPIIWRLKPDTILVSERGLGAVYARVRDSRLGRLLQFHPRLVLSNGGGSPAPYPYFDIVQHVTPVTYEAAIRAGEPPERHVCLPYGFGSPQNASGSRPTRDPATRRPVVISVGSLDSSRKRMDHVITDVAGMEPRPYLILLGQETDETSALRDLADSLLGPGNFEISSVRPDQVSAFYQRADVFALASLNEAFGRVYIEAMMHGLPCVVHDFPVARYVLGDEGIYVDMTKGGELARALDGALRLGHPEQAERRRVAADARFAWNALIPRYVDLLTARSSD